MPRASAETLSADDPTDDSPDENPAGATASVRTRRIRRIAREVLGYDSFRPGQEEAMQAVVGGRDTLAVLPSAGRRQTVRLATPGSRAAFPRKRRVSGSRARLPRRRGVW